MTETLSSENMDATLDEAPQVEALLGVSEEASAEVSEGVSSEVSEEASVEAPAAPKRSRGKTVAKYAGLTLLFCAILTVLVAGASYVLHPKNNSEEAGMMDVRTYSVLAEPEQTIDALFVGNSIIATDVSPMEIWERSGITSYVCAANGERMTFVHYLLEQTFQKQSPKYVFIEADMIYTNSDFSHLAREILRETFPGLLYHHRWCELTIDDFTQPIQYTNILDNKGFNAKARTFKIDNANDMASTEDALAVSKANKFLLEDAKKLCEANGAELIIIAMPMPTVWDGAHHNGMAQLAEELGISFIDLNKDEQLGYKAGKGDADNGKAGDSKVANDDAQQKGNHLGKDRGEGDPVENIDWGIDARDEAGHLNYRGASKVSNRVSDILVGMGLDDHRGDARYSTWDDCLISYHAYMEELRKNPEQYDAAGTHVG